MDTGRIAILNYNNETQGRPGLHNRGSGLSVTTAWLEKTKDLNRNYAITANMGNEYMSADANLDDYVSHHPDAIRQLKLVDGKPGTAFIVDDEDTRLAEMRLIDIQQGIKSNAEFLPGVTYKDIAENTSRYENQAEIIDESLYHRTVSWLNKHKKTTLAGMGTFAGIMLLYVGCELTDIYSVPDYKAHKISPAVANTPTYKIQKDINQAKVFLSDDSPIQLDKNGYGRLAKSYTNKLGDYRKDGLDTDKISELEKLAKQFEVKAK
ncbi:MAG: hypothetical protein KAS17_06900 [Victivallaceae bacterium]|nr:hypothetical protein [Victivallaceae bacterium]